MPITLDEFISAYERTTGNIPRKDGDGYRMPCLHRGDTNPSLVALHDNDGGLVLLDNGAALSPADRVTTIKAVGLSPTGGKAKPLPVVDLIPEGRLPATIGVLGVKVEEEYEYRDANGWPVFDVVRLGGLGLTGTVFGQSLLPVTRTVRCCLRSTHRCIDCRKHWQIPAVYCASRRVSGRLTGSGRWASAPSARSAGLGR
jgi:hypothetical protein